MERTLNSVEIYTETHGWKISSYLNHLIHKLCVHSNVRETAHYNNVCASFIYTLIPSAPHTHTHNPLSIYTFYTYTTTLTHKHTYTHECIDR